MNQRVNVEEVKSGKIKILCGGRKDEKKCIDCDDCRIECMCG
jgi:hypothetical protein